MSWRTRVASVLLRYRRRSPYLRWALRSEAKWALWARQVQWAQRTDQASWAHYTGWVADVMVVGAAAGAGHRQQGS